MRNPSVWSWLAVALGLALRLYHFLRCPAVWQDEAALMINVLELDYAQMFGPLLKAEAAPPLFLVLQKAIIILFGDSEYAFRFIPCLVSMLGLVVFARLMLLVRPGWPAVLGTLLYACSDRLLWHSCEAKPYIIDSTLAVIFAYWFVRSESWSLAWRCLPLTVVVPIAMWCSFPFCFVIGGVLLGLVPANRQASSIGRLSYLLLTLAVFTSFLALALGPAKAQRHPEMDACWVTHFPDYSKPWLVPVWVILSTFEVARYCFLPIGQVMIVFSAIGGWQLLQRGEYRRLAVAITPMVLALIAALLKAYPYGSSRLEVFVTGGLTWLSVEGFVFLWHRLASRSQWLALSLLIWFLVPIALTLFYMVSPWPRDASDLASSFVLQQKQQSDVVVFNHWEYEYYFRNASSSTRFWNGAFQPSETLPEKSKSLWVIHNSKPVLETYPFPLPSGWNVAEVYAFQGLRVFRLKAD